LDRGCEGKGHGCGQLWALREMLERHIMLVCYHCLSPMLDDRLDREERGGQTQQSRQVILPHFTKMRPHTMFSSKAKEEEEKSHGHENWHGGFIVIPKKSVLFLIFYSVLPYSFSDFFPLSHLFVKPTARRLLFPISFLLYGAKKIWNRVVLCFILFMSTFPLCSSPWESIPRASFLLIWKGACHIRVRIHGIDSKLMFRVHLPASKS